MFPDVQSSSASVWSRLIFRAAKLAEIHAELIFARAMLRVQSAHLRMLPRLELFHHALQIHARTPCGSWAR
jgi:hypothetical protein